MAEEVNTTAKALAHAIECLKKLAAENADNTDVYLTHQGAVDILEEVVKYPDMVEEIDTRVFGLDREPWE